MYYYVMLREWPFQGDDELTRARKIAISYRAHLKLANPEMCATVDETMTKYGQFWLTGGLSLYDDDDEVTTREAANLVSTTPECIRRWACSPNPEDPTQILLPRFGKRGRDTLYLVKDVRRAASIMQHHRATHRRGRHKKVT